MYKYICNSCKKEVFIKNRTRIWKIKNKKSIGICRSCAGKLNNSKVKNHKPGFNYGKTRFKKGVATWNKGKHTGVKPWLGKKRSMETKKKISESLKNSKNTVRGNNHHNWTGGKSNNRNKYIMSFIYRLWRKQVFERDNYTCVICGQIGGDLQADHIKPWCEYPDLRYEIDNGRTLCKKCHYKIGWNIFKKRNPKIIISNVAKT